MIKKKASTLYAPDMQAEQELPHYFETYLESKFNVIEQKFEEIATIKQDIASIKKLLIGDDGENSLVNRVAQVEKELFVHKKESDSAYGKLEECLLPKSFLDRPVKVKHLIIFGLLMLILSDPHIRETLMGVFSGTLALFPLLF